MLHPLLSPSQTHYHAFGGKSIILLFVSKCSNLSHINSHQNQKMRKSPPFPLLLLPSSSTSTMSGFPLTEFPDFKGLFYLLFPFPLLSLGHLQYYKMYCRVPRISANVLPGQNAMMVC